MIPKLIHYCWFSGNPKPTSVQKCIDSWRKFLPDYQIIEWNEDNFNIKKSISYVKEAYSSKKWAFVTDYVRLKVLFEQGGIYFDTDVEVFKGFDDLLDNRCFLGFESNDYICTATIGCEPHNSFIKIFLESYDSRFFINADGSYDTATTNVVAITKLLLDSGLRRNGKQQQLKDVTIYPQHYFASNDFINIFHKYSSNIYSYHHCQASWYKSERDGSFKDLFRHYLIGKLRNTIGTDRLSALKK